MPRARKTANTGPRPNRVDLDQAQAPVPVVAPGSTEYGQRQKIEAAVAEVPLAQGGGAPQTNPLAAAMAMRPPNPGGLLRPSERNFEPLTAGMNMGPGPGPEALLGARNSTKPRVSDILGGIAEDTGSPLLREMADRARRTGI